ncbi:MAG: HypC/HybG/HupF family hydrogenase formation chaperone [Candidatus Omnitrophica bacterium]|nr:HypC/HybG/HupF family hydrogenase formation chaperone [Candidatus Omnitrophota bacterium]
MCLGIPMKIVSLKGENAVVKSGKTERGINIGLLKGVRMGDYVIVHAGFAIEKLDEKRALETLDILRQMRV